EQARTLFVEASRIEEMLLTVEAITPDTEDFGNNIGSYALNAATSIYETLQFILDKDLLHIYNIGTYLTDTVDFKICEQEDLTDEQIDKEQMMIEVRSFLLEQVKSGRSTSVSKSSGSSAKFGFKKLFGFRK